MLPGSILPRMSESVEASARTLTCSFGSTTRFFSTASSSAGASCAASSSGTSTSVTPFAIASCVPTEMLMSLASVVMKLLSSGSEFSSSLYSTLTLLLRSMTSSSREISLM